MKKLVLGLLAAVLISGGAIAEEQTVELRFSHDLPTKHPLHSKGFVAWADSITEASGGTLKFSFFPTGQLGKAENEYDLAKHGIADFVWANPGHTPGRFPVMSLAELPFFIKDGLGGTRAFTEWYQNYKDKEMGDVHFCVAHLHDPGTLHSRKPVRVPADLKGMTIRPANSTIARFLQAEGASSIQVGPSEAREVLARGAADGITFPWRSIYIFGMNDVVKYHTDMPLYVTNFIIIMNKARYESLSDAQKKVIDDHCTPEWAEKIAAPWIAFDKEGKKMFQEDKDHEVLELTEAEIAEWKAAAEPMLGTWKETVSKAGWNADEIYKAFTDALDANNARF
ncbi:MAG: TRAP transporter substrate-binding protein [Hyphomicrobiales bacterium]